MRIRRIERHTGAVRGRGARVRTCVPGERDILHMDANKMEKRTTRRCVRVYVASGW